MFLKRYLWFGLATIFVSLSVSQAFADECRGLVVKEIPPNTPDEGGSPIAVKQGTVINELHGNTGTKEGTPLTYAVHGGYVYPADHIRLLNCTIQKLSEQDVQKTEQEYVKLGLTQEQDDILRYRLKLDNTAQNADDILIQAVDDRLLHLGFSEADASNAAYAYVKAPSEACNQWMGNLFKTAPAHQAGQMEMPRMIPEGVCNLPPSLMHSSKEQSDLSQKIQTMEEQLLQKGLPRIVTDRAIFAYMKNPSTACGKLVKRAVNGDDAAVSLIGGTSICNMSD